MQKNTKINYMNEVIGIDHARAAGGESNWTLVNFELRKRCFITDFKGEAHISCNHRHTTQLILHPVENHGARFFGALAGCLLNDRK